MSSADTIAASGLAAVSVGIDVSSNNVANADSSGFQPSSVDYQSTVSGGVSASVESPETASNVDRTLTALSGTNLGSETISQMQLLAMFKANVATLNASEQMNQTLFGIKG